MITQTELKSLLSYDPDTGLFTWLVSSGSVSKGTKAGTLHQNGYVYIRIRGKQYRAHRLAWLMVYGYLPGGKVLDHTDGRKTNNRIVNLRLATHTQNQSNRKTQTNNKSGCTGVVWRPERNKYFSHIQVNGRQIHIGYFSSLEEAVSARKRAELNYFGDFIRKDDQP